MSIAIVHWYIPTYHTGFGSRRSSLCTVCGFFGKKNCSIWQKLFGTSIHWPRMANLLANVVERSVQTFINRDSDIYPANIVKMGTNTHWKDNIRRQTNIRQQVFVLRLAHATNWLFVCNQYQRGGKGEKKPNDILRQAITRWWKLIL